MGLKTYKPARRRFTWRNRRTNNNTGGYVLGPCKDQRGRGGLCTYMALTSTVEAHARLKSIPDPELSISDLEIQGNELKDNALKDKGRVERCLYALKCKGVTRMSEEINDGGSGSRVKIKNFKGFTMSKSGDIKYAVEKYFPVGPMVGVFAVYGNDLDLYSSSAADEIHYNGMGKKVASHCVSLPGFGVQAVCPFWEFQNSYGTTWRGAARGFGLLFAVHLVQLFGIEL